MTAATAADRKRRTRRTNASAGFLTIGALSRATRIPVETLRTWERRYGSPVPTRKPSGHRVYPAGVVDQLRRVALLLSQGHRAGDVLGLTVPELDARLAISEPRHAEATEAPAAEGWVQERSLGAMLRATAELDREGLERELRASWVRIGPLRFLQECAAPLMVEVGRAWHHRELEIRHEHFASACVCGFLRKAREPYDHEARGPRVLAATLSGEMHEGGLLMACLLVAVRGHRVVYLGADTPAEQVAAAALEGGIGHVAISVSGAVPRARSQRALARLRHLLPRRVQLWVGGAGAPPAGKGIVSFATLDALDALLARSL